MIRPISLLALFLLWMSSALAQSIDKAQKAAEEGDWKTVIAATKTILKSDPTNPRALLLQTYGYLQSTNIAESLTPSGALVKHHPDLMQGWILHGEALLMARLSDSAITVLEECVQRFPDSARATFSLGMAYARLEQCDKAITPLEETMFKRPDNMAIVGQLAQCYAKVDRHQEAADLYGRIFELQPNDTFLAFALSESLLRLEQYDSVVSIMDIVLTTEPNNTRALTAKAFALQRTNDSIDVSQDVVNLLTQVTQLQPENADAFYNLGSAQHLIRDHNAAIISLKKAIDLNPKLGEAWYNLGLVYSDEGFVEEAIRAFKRTSLILPTRAAECYQNIAVLYRKEELFDQAVEAHKRSISMAPNVAIVHGSYAETLVEFDKYEEGIEFMEGALKAFPGDPDLLFNVTKCYIRLGFNDKRDAAIAELDKIKPEYADILRTMLKM